MATQLIHALSIHRLTTGDIHATLNHVLTAEGLPPATRDDIRNFVGQGARAPQSQQARIVGLAHIGLERRLDGGLQIGVLLR